MGYTFKHSPQGTNLHSTDISQRKGKAKASLGFNEPGEPCNKAHRGDEAFLPLSLMAVMPLLQEVKLQAAAL